MAAETANPPGMLPSQGVQRPDRRCIVLFVNMPRTQNLNVSMPSLPLVHGGHRRTIKKMLSPLAALVSCKRNESCLRLLYHTKSGEAMLFSAAPGGKEDRKFLYSIHFVRWPQKFFGSDRGDIAARIIHTVRLPADLTWDSAGIQPSCSCLVKQITRLASQNPIRR